jgi:DNA (cytosine-5)-methyltransferase 1
VDRPRLLDLFCGAGGCSAGYQRAGFYVVGVDIEPQPRYAGDEFVQADAMTFPLDGFDAYHGSPPCQGYSKRMRHLAGTYPHLIAATRERFRVAGRPWIIENVEGAPLAAQCDLFGSHGVELCGSMFGLRVFRHRLFETSFPIAAPRGCDHSRLPMNPHFSVNRRQWRTLLGPGVPLEGAWRKEMGVAWMSQDEAREAIPPAFTEYVGARLLAHITSERAA